MRLGINYLGFSLFADGLVCSGEYDLVQVEWVETALLMGRRGAPMVLDAHDVISKPAERAMLQSHGMTRALRWSAWKAIRALELRLVSKFDTVITLSDYDRQYLLAMEPGVTVRTVPIPAGLDATERTFSRRDNTILFLASFKHRPVNVAGALWFHREVLPLVRRQVPDARFIIAGYGPPEELTALPKTDPLTEVPGFVEDLDRCYKEAAVFVAPILTGGGIIVKVLDALAAGTPLVTTAYGNEGVGAVPGRDLLVANEPADFAAAVVRLLRNPELAQGLADAGKAFVAANYGRQAVMEKLEGVYAEVRGGR